MMKTTAIIVLTLWAVAMVSANRYVCDTAAYEAVEDTVADIDYDQRYQQKDIDDFIDQLDNLKALAEGNNSCGALEFHNVDDADYSIILGGCENLLHTGSDYSAIGGGQKNWGYTDAKLIAIAGGFHNIATGDWATIIGGIKNKAYSNYASVMGGYLGKANSKFATVLGGSKNTVSGRYGMVMGQKADVTGDYSMGLSFDGGASCNVRGSNTFGACTESFVLSGAYGDFDILADLTARRQLSDISKQVEEVEKENAELEKELQAKLQALLTSGSLSTAALAGLNGLMSAL